MLIVYGNRAAPELNAAIGDFVSWEVWNQPGAFRDFGSLGIVDDRAESGPKLVGGVIFHNWDAKAGVIEISAAATTPRWLTPRVLRTMHEIPFVQFGCQMIVQRNSANNTRLHSQLRRLGYSEQRFPRLAGRNEDQIIWWLTDDAWRDCRLYRSK